MQRVRGSIYDDGSVVVEDVDVWVDVTPPSGSQLGEWHGEFAVAGTRDIPTGTFRLELDDGGAGEIIINRVTLGSHADTKVEFQGSGLPPMSLAAAR